MHFLSRLRRVWSWVVVLCLIPTLVQAAALTSLTDNMSRQQTSQLSNHQIQFTTPTGVDANTDTITVTFASGFDLSTLVVADANLLHGPSTGLETSETLAASASAGVWGFSVSGQVITFTAPTNAAAGEIATSDKVTIRLGTNAGGTHQITNPSSASTYSITFGGTFGDAGSLTVPIISPGSIAVSATVGSTTTNPGGGGGGGGSTDGTPPILSNIQVINITSNSAQVTWQTDEAADSRVDYGTTFFYTSGPASDSNRVLNHLINLNSLAPNTTYNFIVTSKDAAGNAAVSTNFTFTTLGPPQLSNVHVENITQNSAHIVWDTDVPSNSVVNFGTSVSYGQTMSDASLVTHHDVLINGLTGFTLYHFFVQSTEGGGLSSASADQTFSTTGDVTPPSNPFGFTATPDFNAIDLSWTNPTDPDFSFVRILARTDRYPTSPTDGRAVYQGTGTSVIDPNLTAGVRVYYTIFASDFTGNFSSGALADAVPLAPIVPPTPTTTPPIPPKPPVPPTKPPTPPTKPPTQPSGTTTTPPVATTTLPVIPPPVSSTSTIPEVPVIPPPQGPAITVEYFGASGNIPLKSDTQGRINALAGQSVLVRIPTRNLAETPVSGTITVGGSTYALTQLPGGDAWGASFIPGVSPQTLTATITFRYADGSQSTVSNIIRIQGLGQVRAEDTKQGVAAAQIYISVLQAGQEVPYKASTYGQSYPVTTGPNGEYGLVVPNGTYRVRVEKEGYVTKTVDITVGNNILSSDIELTPNKLPFSLLSLLQSPTAKAIANIAGPLVALASIIALLSGLSIINALSYLYYLFTQPILLLWRRKRRKWGMVYNSLTKLPIELAVVRLLDAKTNRVLQTRITDPKGRYSFIVHPGSYKLEVTKQNFISPSVLMKDEKVDIDLVDLYHGETIDVKEDVALGVNIPIDPIVKEETPKTIILKKFLRNAQNQLGLVGALITLISLIISPSWPIFILLVIQILMYLLFRRLSLPPKPKEWGYVHENLKEKKTLDYVVVRIFDKKYNKLLETQVTNKSGKYGFIVGKNNYYVTANRIGYDTFNSGEIDMMKGTEHAIDKPIALKPKATP